ncbi:MAG: ABC transporter permease [Rhodospirillaceae bacterium]|nr:ABC transporter permease [Rhodospirillaceae bacterium]MBT3909059.1 ABC transporter permease [Rhodospirillaceae bacterium]MBT5299826.1 ABC transporter permease [Rhodospirillaceae bacterium]MBT5515540.1 ABC transporter permease [Rhodospirillaceae bacterium]MBT6086926.1 ABC transporter permease [Rhodospirillaceae bacterium]
MSLPDHADFAEKLWHWTFIGICALVFLFLIAPILVIIPLSFNAEPYFTFNAKMVALDPEAYSVRWYQDFWSKTIWRESIWNSLFIAVGATILATALGTLAALGLSRPEMPFKPLIMGLLISPMIVPLIITAAGIFFFYASINEYLQLTGSYLGVILAHTVLGTPFVVITVTATLSGFDHSLTRAGAMCGADPTTVFFKVIMPLILPGVISGALFAFVTSFDEVVVVLFVASVEQQTIPRQMWAGMRESISPTILAVATILICISILLLATVEILRRRSERLRGLSAG